MDSNEQKLIDAGCSCDLSVGWVCGFHKEFTEYKKAAQAHTDALIAAAIEECAKRITVFSALGGWLDSPAVVSEDIRSLTPPTIRRALEVREVKAALSNAYQMHAFCAGHFLSDARDCCNGGRHIVDLDRRREELEGEKHG